MDAEEDDAVAYLVDDNQDSSIENQNEMWTRVFQRDSEQPGLPAIFVIGTDLLFD